MRNFLLLFGICAGLASAQEFSLLRETPAQEASKSATARDQKIWHISVASLAVANALDVHSSWGKHELNSTLSGPTGNFGRDGALIKLGLQGGLMGLEFLITRGHPSGKLYRTLSIVNFGAAATIGGVAARNYTVPRP
jgi:hypothetical protein